MRLTHSAAPVVPTPQQLLLMIALFGFIGCDSGEQAVEGDDAGECSDGLDNDQNGDVDCADAGCLNATACSGDDDDSALGNDDDSALGDDDDSALGPCAAYIGQASSAEIQATPRLETNLESLAIAMTGALTAPQAVYDRLLVDIPAIHQQMSTIAPNSGTINHLPVDDMTSLMVGFDATHLAEVQAGTYSHWDCPNSWYELQSTSSLGSAIQLNFEGIYNMPLLATEYATLPGVQYAERNWMAGGGSTICGTIDGNTWHIVMVHGYGDCPSGCINRDYYYFTTIPGGAPVYVDSWANSSSNQAPSWQQNYGC